MAIDYQDPEVIQRVLRDSRIIAVVGLSPDPQRPSWYVADYLKQHGYRIIPVNPNASEVLGEKSYPTLGAVPEPIDLVDVFRPAAHCLAVAREAVAVKAKAIWLQQGIISLEAAELAHRGGLDVVMDRCTKIEHQRFFS